MPQPHNRRSNPRGYSVAPRNAQVGQDKPMPFLEGYAVGGPRDGVKIQALATWDGKVRKPYKYNESAETQQRAIYYLGYYKWTHIATDATDFPIMLPKATWVWIDDELTTQDGHNKGYPQLNRKPRDKS